MKTGGPGGLPHSPPPAFCNGKARPLLLPTQPAGLATCKHAYVTREAGAERPLGAASRLRGPVTPRDPSPLQDPVLCPASPRAPCPCPVTSPDPAEGFRPRVRSPPGRQASNIACLAACEPERQQGHPVFEASRNAHGKKAHGKPCSELCEGAGRERPEAHLRTVSPSGPGSTGQARVCSPGEKEDGGPCPGRNTLAVPVNSRPREDGPRGTER